MRYDLLKMVRGRLAFVSTFAPALLWVGTSLAEPANETVKVARRRFQEGVAAADARNYEAARVAFQQAYALKPHASVLRNLGQAELKTGRYLEAARHLSMFIRDTTFGGAAERNAAKKALAEAETKVGKLLLEVDIAGAEVTVDGEMAGRSPLGADPVYVEPGQRLVRIQKEGYEPYDQTQTFEADRTIQLKIALRPLGPVPTEAASVSRIHSTLIDPTVSTVPDAARPAGPTPFPPDARERSRVEPGTVALIAGAGLTVVATGLGVAFKFKMVSLDDDAKAQRATLERTLGTNGCSASASSAAQCAELDDTLDRRNQANSIANGAFVATGVLGVATAVAAVYLLWPEPRKASMPSAGIAPATTGTGATLWLAGWY